MKTRAFITLFLLVSVTFINAQMCPGGAVNFASGAVTFDPAWIYGCNTGTSCNGGVNFDNRVTCQPTTAMDACAPAPTCGVNANSGSNIWFKFYAASTTVTISCFQNTSFVIAIQAFRGGPTCGSLTQIGCAIAGGPSSGVNLTMTGLTVGQLYYYRIFGSASPVSQRTGLYCFCGSTGLDYYILAKGLSSFKGYASDQSVKLTWEATDDVASAYDIEVSRDKVVFNTVGTVSSTYNRRNYSFDFEPGNNDDLYYRLRYINADGEITYSPVLKLNVKGVVNESVVYIQKSRQLRIHVAQDAQYLLCSVPGAVMQQFSLKKGDNVVPVKVLPSGVYFLKKVNGNNVQKIAIFQ